MIDYFHCHFHLVEVRFHNHFVDFLHHFVDSLLQKNE